MPRFEIDRVPPLELPPLVDANGKPGPYAFSDLKSVVGTRMNPLAREIWYEQEAALLATPTPPVITAVHPQLAQWMEVMGGLDPRWYAEQAPAEQWPLSRVIPRVVASRRFPVWPIPSGTYWFDYDSFTKSPVKLPETPWTHDVTSKLPEGSYSILGCIAQYPIRASLWMRHRYQFWQHPFVQQFDAVVCPDFSSYLDDPKPQAAVGERMTQQFVELGHQYGFQMIPILSWQDETALRRQADLFGAMYPRVNTIYIELLASQVNKEAWFASRLEQIQKHLAHLPFRFLLSGVDAGWVMRELHEIFPNGNFHAVTVWPWLQTAQEPGLNVQKARYFRRKLARLEDFHRGENLPGRKAKPEDMTILLRVREEAQRQAEASAREADAEAEA